MAQPVALEVMRVLGRVAAADSGALVRARTDGSMAGALLVEHGRVCWAISKRYSVRLTDILLAEQGAESPSAPSPGAPSPGGLSPGGLSPGGLSPGGLSPGGLSPGALADVVAQCARERMPFAETLLARGLVSLPVLHRALLRHTCEALDCLVRDEASPWSWVAHAGYGYHPMLTFSPAEVLTGVRALANPVVAARARARLAEVVRPGALGFAMERAPGAKLPLAQRGCEGIDLAALADLAAQADEVMAVAATVGIEVAMAELEGLACASWIEDDVLFVLLCDGELAFNRLLAQVAVMTIQP